MNKAMVKPSRPDGRLERCPACQLQLCKAREARPHAGLVEASGSGLKEGGPLRGADRAFTCQTCNATLINSPDMNKPGWSQPRPV
jgi:hypothetical protein